MTPKTIFEVLDVLLRVARRVGDRTASTARKLKDILPKRTYTRRRREAEAEKDREKFGR